MRDYVSTKGRDGERKDRTAQSAELTQRATLALGARAHHRGYPRWSNPLVGDRARLWTRGWNTAHLVGRPGGCPGCRLCVVGTVPARQPPASDAL